jgi:hypothetical protein
MESLTPKAMIKQLSLFSIGIVSAGMLLAPLVFASKAEAYYERTPGSFACRNSLDPQCKNPKRSIGEAKSGSFACRNNPGPACTKPPRISQSLKSGNWSCRFNQNTPSCGNPIRYTVPASDRSNWPGYFKKETASTTTPR